MNAFNIEFFAGVVVTHVHDCSAEVGDEVERNLLPHFRTVLRLVTVDNGRMFIATNGSCDSLVQEGAPNREAIAHKLLELSTKLGATQDLGESLSSCLDDLTLCSGDASQSQ